MPPSSVDKASLSIPFRGIVATLTVFGGSLPSEQLDELEQSA
jgi:hypothetical protein